MKKTFNTVLLSLLFSLLFGQSPAYLTNGNVRAQFAPGGATEPTTGAFMELQQGEDWVSLIYDVGLLIGGLDPGGNLKTYSLRGNTVSAAITGIDAEIIDPWRVTSDQVAAHLADFEDNGIIDNPIDAIFAWPARGNAFSEQYNGFEIISDNMVTYADFWDQDANGVYNPDQGDYPVLFVRGCGEEPLVPSEMLVYPFTLSPNGAEGPDDFQVFMTAFRFGCEEAESVINNSFFLSYKINNRTIEPLNDAFFGYWIDGDIGCFSDDYLGVDPDRFATYFYNSSATDGTCNPGGSFGNVPPVVGVDLLRGPLNISGEEEPLRSVMPVFNSSVGAIPAGATGYQNPVELYNYLSGTWRDGNPLVDSGIGYEAGNPIDFAFTGDPAQGSGWTETGEGNPTGDRRALISSGPFTLFPGAVNRYILAFTYEQNTEVTNLEQIVGLKNNLDALQALFDNCFDTDNLPGMEVCTSVVTDVDTPLVPTDDQIQLYPNPTQTEVTVMFPVEEKGQLSVYTTDGQLLLQKRTISAYTTLDCSQWPAALYVLRWESEGQVLVQKLLVD